VLATMFASPEFWDRRYYGSKFKTPYEYVMSCARAAGIEVSNYRPLYGAMQLLGMPIYGCQTPNGYANTQDAWLNPDGMMTRLSFATALSNGNLPLNRPPFDEDEAAAKVRRVVSKNGRGGAGINYPPGFDKMPPLDAKALKETIGEQFSTSTNEAIEAAPQHLRAAMILGSPEFMKR